MSLHKDVADDILLHCDRTKSQEARYALERIFWQPLRRSGIELHPSCILSPEKDILLAQESQKHRISDGLWQCSLCAKKFRAEHFLDKHLARKHPLFRSHNGSVCLADYCGSLIPCVPLTKEVLPPVSSAALNTSQGLDTSTELSATQKEFCHHSGLRQKRIHACADIIHRCMRPPRNRLLSWPAEIHFERFKHELCERAIQVECVKREDVWSKIGTPDNILRSGSWMLLRHKLGWALFICLSVIAVILRCAQTNAPSRRRKVRRSARRSNRKLR